MRLKMLKAILKPRLLKLEDLVGNARLIDETKIDTSSVSILSKVTIKNRKTELL